MDMKVFPSHKERTCAEDVGENGAEVKMEEVTGEWKEAV
jgi:hypothetical protein